MRGMADKLDPYMVWLGVAVCIFNVYLFLRKRVHERVEEGQTGRHRI